MATRTAPGTAAPGFLTLLWLALIAEAIYLSVLRNGASFDGAEQLLYTQYLDLGYGRSQPPLYTWLLILSQQVFGVTLLAENLLKFALAGVAFTAIYKASSRLWRSPTSGAVSVLLCLLVPEIVWEMQRNYSHSVLLLALTALMILGYLALSNRKTALGYAGFGVILGLMVLAKYNAVLIILALALADLWGMRRNGVVARPQILITLAVALALTAPHLVWALRHVEAVTALSGSLAIGAAPGVWQNWATGLGAVLAALLSLFILIALFACIVPGYRSALALLRGARWRGGDPASVLLLCALIFLALTLVLALASTATNIRPRWLLPVVVPVVIWLGGQAALCAPRTFTALHRTALALAALACIGLAVEERRPGARTAYDYAGLATAVQDRMQADALIFDEYQIFANLRLSHPDLALVNPAMPRLPDLRARTHPVALWSGRPDAGAKVLDYAQSLGLTPPPGAAPVEFSLSRRFGEPRAVFALALSPPGGP